MGDTYAKILKDMYMYVLVVLGAVELRYGIYDVSNLENTSTGAINDS